MSKKSICFCLDVWYPYLGGGQDRVLNLANQLSSWFRVTVLTRNLGAFKNCSLDSRVNLVQLGTPRPFHHFPARIKFIFQALFYLKNHSFDLIDFQPFSPWLTAWMLKKINNRQAMVVTVLGQGNQVIGLPRLLQPWFRRLNQNLLSKASWPLVISDTYQLLKNLNSPGQVVTNGVDLDQIDQVKSQPKQPKSLVFLGRFCHQKGLDILLPAFKQVLNFHPQATLTLIGSGPQLPLVKKIIHQLQLQDRVVLAGQKTQADLIKTLKSKTIFVLASRFEGQAISLLLAMACRLAIVATKVGDNQKLITADIGYLVKPEDQSALTLALVKLLNQPGLQTQMGDSGYQKVKHNYTWTQVASKYQRLITQKFSSL